MRRRRPTVTLPLHEPVNTIFTMFNDSDAVMPKIPHLRAAGGGDKRFVMHFNDPKLLFRTNDSREHTPKVTDKELDLLLVTIEVAKKIPSNQPPSGNTSDAKLMDRPNWIRWSEELCAADIKKNLEKIPYMPQNAWGTGVTTVPANIITGSRYPEPSSSKDCQSAVSRKVPGDASATSVSHPELQKETKTETKKGQCDIGRRPEGQDGIGTQP
jgi:hypothetical protein